MNHIKQFVPATGDQFYKLASRAYHHMGLIFILVGLALAMHGLNLANPNPNTFMIGTLLILAGLVVGLIRAAMPSYAPLRRKLHRTARRLLFVERYERSRH